MVELDNDVPEHRDREQKVLHIDLSGEGEEILWDEKVVAENPTKDDPKYILDQDTESEETATKDTSDTQRSSPNFYQERNMAADQEMNESGTSSTNSVASSGATMGQITATEAITVLDATDHESAEEDDDTSTGLDDIDQVQIVEETETSDTEIERKDQ